MTLTEALELYQQYIAAKGQAKRSLEGSYQILNRLLSYLHKEWQITGVQEVEATHLTKYQEWLYLHRTSTGKPAGLSYQSHSISKVKHFFRYLTSEGYILSNPADRLKGPRVPRSLPRAILTHKQVCQILAVIDTSTPSGIRDRAIIELLYSSGIRVNELINLGIYDLDIEEGYARIHKGKGGKDRLVPVGKQACKWLKKYLEVRSHFTGEKYTENIFLSLRGRPMHRQNINGFIRKYSKKAGLKVRITSHIFRHSMATNMLKGKASLRHIQVILGHAWLTTTQIYTKVDMTDLKRIHTQCHPREKG